MKQSLESQMIDGVVESSSKRVDLSQLKDRRDPPVKVCYDCFLVVHSATRMCYECGFEFYPSKAKK